MPEVSIGIAVGGAGIAAAVAAFITALLLGRPLQAERANNLRWVRHLETQIASLEQLAFVDPLTRLSNRRYLDEQLPREVARSERSADPLALLFVDVDGLKAFNDSLGHQAGDELLQQVAKVLASTARQTDTVIRYGGDEFVILAPRSDPVGGEKLAGRIMERIGELPPIGGHPIRVSIGIACYPHHARTTAELLANADSALYKAKSQPPPRVAVYRRHRVLGEWLQELGVSTQAQVEEALRYALESGRKGRPLAIGEALVELGYATPGAIDQALTRQTSTSERPPTPAPAGRGPQPQRPA